ncbi:hypothetical protein ROA7450_04204 [Roseovarius albus]|uniref:DUF1127 domain-containing protein n=1 Tax=Roseovarius albus TaxID=1247867 RepID=A0A1X7ACH4_9RHOB|nr:hypothetical protein ROA7450_04204 [Roseovarius albus]
MPVSTQRFRLDRSHTVAASFAFLAKVGAKAKTALKAFQKARMLSALSNLGDYQLAQIGISRSDIPKYAEKLMADE